jgi:hypothetical protein
MQNQTVDGHVTIDELMLLGVGVITEFIVLKCYMILYLN